MAQEVGRRCRRYRPPVQARDQAEHVPEARSYVSDSLAEGK